MTTLLTKKEVAGLNGIVKSQFQDGGDPIGTHVWSWSANPFSSARTFSGVVASLVKKGMAKTSGTGEDATVAITEQGFSALTTARG
ncbi:MAG: hypothetical protein AB7O57_02870 [Hyphomicrobiaceae bacterium]